MDATAILSFSMGLTPSTYQGLLSLTGLSTKAVFTLQHLHQKVNTSQLSVE